MAYDNICLLSLVTLNAKAASFDIEEEEEEATAIEEAKTETTAPVVTGYFTLDGRPVDNPLRGNIYIQKMSNGVARKVFFK